MKRVLSVLLLVLSGAAYAVPVQIDHMLFTVRPDYWLTSDVSTYRNLTMGDCMTCYDDYSSNWDLRVPTEWGDVIGQQRHDVTLSRTVSDDLVSVDFDSHIEVYARVPEESNGAVMIRTAISQFSLGFTVFEPVLFTGSTGAAEGQFHPNYYGGASTPIASGTVLQPGQYYTSFFGGWVGTNGIMYSGSFFAMQDLSLNYTFTAVPEPGTLALFGLGLIAAGAIRRRNGISTAMPRPS